jgi:hypothetical protein
MLFVAVIALVVGCALGDGDWGARFRAIPSASRCVENEAIYTSQPHLAGTPGDRWMAEYTYAAFKSSGLQNVVMDEHSVLLTYPLSASVVMSQPVHFQASLTEPVVEEDPTSGDSRIVAPYNAYSANGSATAAAVYANYGRPEGESCAVVRVSLFSIFSFQITLRWRRRVWRWLARSSLCATESCSAG